MAGLFNDFISLFYPRNCINCQRPLSKQEEYICIHCILAFPKAKFHEEDENPLANKLSGVPILENAFAFLILSRKGIAQKLIHKIKYEGMQELAFKLGLWFGYEIESTINDLEIDYIVPIPLHKSRLRERGYNQCDAIANGLSQALSISCALEILKRTMGNSTQTKESKVGRWQNVENLFEVSDNQEVEGKHILLIDDVLTTGATIDSACQALMTAGARKISIACLASRH